MEPLRFLYAAAPRLDKPLTLGEGGMKIAPQAGYATYEATRRLVDCALSLNAAFVLLKGELCDANCGVKAPLFLIEQTTRLSDAGIACHILNEGAPLDARWLACFPPNVNWLSRSEDEINLPCGPLSMIHEVKLRPLQGIGPEDNGPCGAWLISLTEGGEPSSEFIELDALRWERRELDVTPLETAEDLAASWQAMKEELRGSANSPNPTNLPNSLNLPKDRPVLLRLNLTGVMKKRSIFGGLIFEGLIEKLNADEDPAKNFVLIDSLSDDTTPQPAMTPAKHTKSTNGTGTNSAAAIDTDFRYFCDLREEISFFKSSIDPRVGLFEALKERGLLKRILSTEAATILENITETDVDSILKEADGMALGFFERFEHDMGGTEVSP